MTCGSPLHCPITLRRLSREEFDDMARLFIGHAFASQNELGRLCVEAVYRNDLALRLEAAGLGRVATEIPLTVSLRDFRKTYRLDMVVRESFIAELKTVRALLKEHESQLLNYLMIADTPHGKLVNLRPPSVEYRTVNAVVSAVDRWSFRFATDRWAPQNARCRQMAGLAEDLLNSWGAFLDSHLYEEALVHFLGGEERVSRPVPLVRAGVPLGSQVIALITERIGLRVTALAPDACPGYEAQLRRLLALTPLRGLQWLNLHHHDIQLVTVTR